MTEHFRMNDEIRALELRVVDENGASIGVLSLKDALAIAREKGLDLVEIASHAQPPVAKIISFDKFRYQQKKKEKELKSHQKKQEQKQIRIGLTSAINDLMIKAGQIDEFLEKGALVEILLILRGRQKGKKDLARVKLSEFVKLIKKEYKVLREPKFGGYGIMMQIAKR